MQRARLALVALGLWLCIAGPRPALAAEQRAWVRTINDEKTWHAYAKRVAADELGKFIIDVRTNDIYFIDVNLFNIHADFVLTQLLKLPWTAEVIREYNLNYEQKKPRFILGYLTHHLKVDKWTFSFWEGDKADAPTVVRTKQRLAETFFEKDLLFRPDSPAQEQVAKAATKLGIRSITNDELYKSAPFQAFTLGATVGKLRVVPVGTPYESLTFGRDEVVLLQESYPDITPVAGILSTTFSTPLSHVNLRANAWGIPNAGDKAARAKAKGLDGQMIYYRVSDTGLELRAATAAEIASHRAAQARTKQVALPAADLRSPNFAMLDQLRTSDVSAYGTKTANLGEIASAHLPGVDVPAGFGVPFFYYARHMNANGLNERVKTLLADARFRSDATWRKQALADLRAAITAAPIDPEVLNTIYRRVVIKLGARGVFVRSSTNAEDLPGFNGAGLYDTVPNVVGKQALGAAIKTVWASLWNLRAVEERDAFGIDHQQVYAAVMIQIGVKATAAGVLITRNLFDARDGNSYTMNAKWGLGMKVVEGQKIPEQIVYDTTNDGTKILSRSDDATMLVFDAQGGIREIPAPAGGVILSEARAKHLATAVRAFVPLFDSAAPLDVEWVLEGERFWIVQARPFVGR